jgi:hypothetical protein
MTSKPSLQEDERAPKVTWTPLKLPGLPWVELSHSYDFTEDHQALVLSIRLESSGSILRYGMTRRDLGTAWQERSRAERRVRVLSEAQLRKDLYFLLEQKKVPRSALQIEWINFKGRTIV